MKLWKHSCPECPCDSQGLPVTPALLHGLPILFLAGAHVCDISICRGNQRCFKDQLFHARIFFSKQGSSVIVSVFLSLLHVPPQTTSVCFSLFPLISVWRPIVACDLSKRLSLAGHHATQNQNEATEYGTGVGRRKVDARRVKQPEMERIIILKKPPLI